MDERKDVPKDLDIWLAESCVWLRRHKESEQAYLTIRAEMAKLKRDCIAYQGALGYAVPGWHDGKLSDGTVPSCGMCEARDKVAAYTREQSNDQER